MLTFLFWCAVIFAVLYVNRVVCDWFYDLGRRKHD